MKNEKLNPRLTVDSHMGEGFFILHFPFFI